VVTVLFVTSNGTGFGHLTRALAIGRRLGEGTGRLIFTLSAAAPVVRRLGFHVEYLPSYRTPGAGSELAWHRRLRDRVGTLVEELDPGVLVFDGVHPYAALLGVLHDHPELPAVWCRRAMWQPGSGGEFLATEDAFDAVLEPGELAAADDRGLTARRRADAFVVPPITYNDPEELLEREQAERELGLEPGRVNALVQIGGGSDAVDSAVARCLDRLAREPGVQVAALESSISRRLDLPDGVVRIADTYPMSRYYRAFDLTVSASGYNGFHELVRFAVPTLFVPMRRELDDQPARARWAEREGVGFAVEGPDSPAIEERLEELLDPARRERIAARAEALGVENGAGPAARMLAELAAGAGPAARPERRPGWRYRPLVYAWMLARAPAHHLFGFGYRAPRAVCIALGCGEDELGAALDQLPARLDEKPERILVVTDAGDLALLRRRGFAVEYVPPRSEVESRPSGDDYEGFVRRRVEARLAEFRPRAVVGIGAENEARSATLLARDGRGADSQGT
jgi:UDP-N-acetylglucosamine--N-acetylmuramyl-(pentapeptide) pyrophosphoryl-undecaprenol N-acetylglucosamine transferase